MPRKDLLVGMIIGGVLIGPDQVEMRGLPIHGCCAGLPVMRNDHPVCRSLVTAWRTFPIRLMQPLR